MIVITFALGTPHKVVQGLFENFSLTGALLGPGFFLKRRDGARDIHIHRIFLSLESPSGRLRQVSCM
jgi:hypothetical protein